MNMDVVGPAATIAFVALILTLVGLGSWAQDKKAHRGVSILRRRAIRQAGRRAQATVIDVQYKTIIGSNDMVLEIDPQGGQRYRVECAEVISLAQNHFALTGMKLAVFVDPNDPKTVVVDFDDLNRRMQQKSVEDQEKHARMLRGG